MSDSSMEKSDRFEVFLGILMQLALLTILVMVVLLVVLRYVFHTTIIGGNEATVVAFVFATSIGAALALKKDEHISIRYFVDTVFPGQRRLLAIIRWLLLVAINVVLFSYALVWIQKTGHFMMPAMGLPQQVAQASVLVASGLGAYFCLIRLLRFLTSRKVEDA